uniref:Glycoprotein-N-acetylgalactosamine 3-beta-galactosyltransferase 1 n=1 Tax=Daphnia galeata TaxID=27404 RepID=A0A8J2RS15_9CRUS|nr:unnamed protein product [Daphnia galeata]
MFRLPVRRLSFLSILIGAIFGCFFNFFIQETLLQLFSEDIIPEIESSYGNQTFPDESSYIEFTADNPTVEKREEDVGKVPVVLEDLNGKVRVLCWIMTTPQNHETKALAVKETWGKRCNVILFMSSEKDSILPSVQLPVKEGRNELWGKTREAFRYVWEHHQHDVDWFLKADDDTYVIVENLRYFLSAFNTSQPLWFGHKYKTNVTAGFHSGGAGYVLSKEATKRFVEEGYDNPSICKHDNEGAEDVEMGRCMENLQVLTMDTRDSKGRGRFFPFQPDRFYFSRKITNYWYWKFIYYPPIMGPDCCSDSTISFHYVDPKMMHLLDFFFYKIRPYGIVDHRPATPEPPPDLELKATPWLAPNETTHIGGIPQNRNAAIDFRLNSEENVDLQETNDHSDYTRYPIHSTELFDQQTFTPMPLPDSDLTTSSLFAETEIASTIENSPVIQSTISVTPSQPGENVIISNAKKRFKVPFERKTFGRNMTETNRAQTESAIQITAKSSIASAYVTNKEKSVDIPINNNKRKVFRKKLVLEKHLDYQELKGKNKLTDDL